MSIIGTIYEDVTTDVLGEIGTWQWLVTLVATILMTSSFFHHYENIFLLEPNKTSCIPSKLYNNVYNETTCSYKISNGTEIPCNKWQLKLIWMIWIRKSWLLFCDDKMKLLLTAVICRLAAIFGFIIFGFVADSCGRRKAIIVNVFASLIFKAIVTFCDSEAWFKLVLFLGSLFGTASTFLSLIIVCEVASNSWRSWLSVIVISPRLVALVSMVHMANGASNPETYNLIGCLCCIFHIFALRWLPESPQWMLYNRKIQLAERLLSKAAVTNNVKFSAEFKIRPISQSAYCCLEETTTCFNVFGKSNVRVIIAVTIIFWGLFYFVWGSLYLKIYSEGLSYKISLKVFCFLGGMGFLTVIMSNVLTLQRFLIINVAMTASITTGVIMFQQPTVHEILSAWALASGLMVHALILNMTPRFFATKIRATMFGCCHATGELGAILAYVIFIYQAMDDITLVAIEFTLSLMLIFLSLFMPDVDDRELPDVLQDMDYFSELSKPIRWATQKRSSASKEEVEMRIYSFGSTQVPSVSVEFTPSSLARLPNRQPVFRKYWQRLLECIRGSKRRTIAHTPDRIFSNLSSTPTRLVADNSHLSRITTNTLMSHATTNMSRVYKVSQASSESKDSGNSMTMREESSTNISEKNV